MGKTCKKTDTSRSVSYREDKNRGFMRQIDRKSHHSLRNDNRNKDETSFETMRTKKNKYSNW